MNLFGKVHKQILRTFISHGVEFVLIGGHAVVFHGVRRTTADVDILVRPTRENGSRIISAFTDLGLDIEGIQAEDFVHEQVFTFGLEPDAVDILNFSRGVEVEDVFRNAINASIDNLSLKIIDIRDLLKNKEGLHRKDEKGLVDQQDVLALRRILSRR